jgi:hypothetical protein
MARRADDQRKHPRVEARLAMQLAEESLGDALVTTESLNISRGGVYCESAEFLSPLSRVALTVVLPPFGAAGRSRVLRSEGVVVRCEALPPVRGRKRWQLACCFTGLDSDMRALLDAFVTWRAQRGRAARTTRAPRATTAPRPARKAVTRKTVARKAAGKKAAARPRAGARKATAPKKPKKGGR